MVNIMEAYAIVNNSILNVANDLVALDILDVEDKRYQIRLQETPVSVAEIRKRVDGVVVKGHDLSQYVNKFYNITLVSSEVIWLDILINASRKQINLTEFGEFT